MAQVLNKQKERRFMFMTGVKRGVEEGGKFRMTKLRRQLGMNNDPYFYKAFKEQGFVRETGNAADPTWVLDKPFEVSLSLIDQLDKRARQLEQNALEKKRFVQQTVAEALEPKTIEAPEVVRQKEVKRVEIKQEPRSNNHVTLKRGTYYLMVVFITIVVLSVVFIAGYFIGK